MTSFTALTCPFLAADWLCWSNLCGVTWRWRIHECVMLTEPGLTIDLFLERNSVVVSSLVAGRAGCALVLNRSLSQVAVPVNALLQLRRRCIQNHFRVVPQYRTRQFVLYNKTCSELSAMCTTYRTWALQHSVAMATDRRLSVSIADRRDNGHASARRQIYCTT